MIAIDYRGQTYRQVGSEPYTRRDGTKTTLSIWRSNCMTCNAEFECTTSADPEHFKPLRNCPEHRGLRGGWKHRVRATDPAVVSTVLPDGRPIAPLDIYDDRGR